MPSHTSPPTAAKRECETYLNEPNILALLPKALSADVQAVLSDQTRSMCADAAAAGALAEGAWSRVPD